MIKMIKSVFFLISILIWALEHGTNKQNKIYNYGIQDKMSTYDT